MKRLIVTLFVLLVLFVGLAEAQERPPIVADAIALFYPGGGLLYADQPTTAAMFATIEFGFVIWAQQHPSDIRDHAGAYVIGVFTVKALELLETHFAAMNFNARLRLSPHPVDLSPRLSLTFNF